MRRLGVLVALLGGVLCLVALFVPFDTGYPPIGDPAIVPVALLVLHFDWFLPSVPLLLGLGYLFVTGLRAWQRRAAISFWVVGTSLLSLGWVVFLLYLDAIGRTLGESTTNPALGFWLIVAGLLLGSLGTIQSHLGRPAAPLRSG